MNLNSEASPADTAASLPKLPAQRIAAHKKDSGIRKYWPAATIGALCILMGVGVLWWSISGKSSMQYQTMPVTRGAISRTATATGTVNPVLTIIVGAYDSGIIQNIYCDYNTRVRAGQVCAKIDPRPYQATLDQYSGQLLRDQAILAKDRMDLERYQHLTWQNAIPRQQAEDQAYVVNQDEGTVKLDQGYVEGAKVNLEYTNIVSPVDGTVVSRNITGGQTIASNFQTPTLFLIATDLKQMEVDTNTSEGDMGGVKEGDKATFTVDAFPKRIFRGTVTQVRKSPNTVQNVVTYDVVITVDNSDLALAPGMTASTQIVIDSRTDVVRVPDQALRYTPGGLAAIAPTGARASETERVWMLRGGTPVAVPIVPGLNDGNFTEIVEGDLHLGDQVITAETGPQGSASSSSPPLRF
jgi:HlyD family secretion protein